MTKATVSPLCATVVAVALAGAGCGSDPVLAPEADTPETSLRSDLDARHYVAPFLSDCVEGNPLDFLDAQGRAVGCATVPFGDDDYEPIPIIVAFGVGVAAGLVAAMIWEVIRSDPPWYRTAKASCRYLARRFEWEQWGIQIEFAANGDIIEWNCINPSEDGFDQSPN